jgi:hypothetical protein
MPACVLQLLLERTNHRVAAVIFSASRAFVGQTALPQSFALSFSVEREV